MSNNLPRPSRIAETFASGAGIINAEYQSVYPALFPGYNTLQKCSKALQDIRALVDGISDHRRHKIQMAARRGTCLDMESLEMELDRLTEDYRSLCRVYEQLSTFQRSFLSGQARQFEIDISTLEHRVREFYKDTWKTTAAGDRSINWKGMINSNAA